MSEARPREIARVVAAATISNFGSMLTRIALPFVAIDVLGASAWDMSALSAARLVPGLVFGIAIAAWIERRRKRGVMIGADLAHAMLLLAVPLAAALGALSIPALLAFAALSGALSYAFGVARASFVPALASREQIVAANARIAAGSNAAEALAFGGGGWLVQLLSAPLALVVDAVSYLASAALLAGIPEREAEAKPPRERGLARALGGLRVIRADARLGALALVSVAVELLSEVLGVVYFLFVREQLGFSPGALGTLFAAGSVAALASSLAAAWLGARFGARGTMGCGLAGGALATAVLALAPGPSWIGAACIFAQQLGDAGLAVFEIHALSARQRAAALDVQSRVHGAFTFFGGWAALAGAALGGALGSVLGPRATIALVAAAMLALGASWLAFAPRYEESASD
ncbi:MAG: MFS transporter [Deltaproteobacteria bacterium]|nr:MFS transporter [Deltaproteobacteria bacterium]